MNKKNNNYCGNCKIYLETHELVSYKCPTCNKYVYIKITDEDGHDMATKNILAKELRVNDYIIRNHTLDKRIILNIKKAENQLIISLKEFGNIKVELTDRVSKIEGGWHF